MMGSLGFSTIQLFWSIAAIWGWNFVAECKRIMEKHLEIEISNDCHPEELNLETNSRLSCKHVDWEYWYTQIRIQGFS